MPAAYMATMATRPAMRRPRTMPLWLVYAPLIAALALRLASEPTANASYLLLAGYALLGRAHIIRALAFSWLFSMISTGLAPEATAAAVGRYAVLFAAAGSAMLHAGFIIRNTRVRPFTLFTLVLGAFIIGHSLMFSPMADVSVLKGLSWTLAMATLVSAWLGLSEAQRELLAQELFWFLVVILVVSLPLVATPLGYLRNGTGFQGILNHPQAFGPTMALLCAWATARMLGEARPPWWLLGVMGTSLAGILMSEARTAGLAMVLGVGLSALLGPSFAGRSIGQMVVGLKSGRVWTVIVCMVLAAVAMAPLIASKLENYITKSGRADVGGLAAAYEHSRGRLMEQMQENIAEHPFTGIGFGIASEPWRMEVSRDPFLGLPVGAAIEKGVVPLMVVEELGVFGAVLVGLWIVRLLRGSAHSGLAPLAVCFVALMLNMGEATLFSPGGFGLLSLILFAWAYACGQTKPKRRHG